MNIIEKDVWREPGTYMELTVEANMQYFQTCEDVRLLSAQFVYILMTWVFDAMGEHNPPDAF
jgi:hypothetical protein